LLCLILFFERVCGPKVNGDNKIKRPCPFLPLLPHMTTHCCLLCKLWFSLSKQPRIIESTWVFMGIIPLVLLYLIKPFFKTKLWDKTLPTTFFDMHTIHCNICKFSRSTCKSSFTTKWPQQMECWWCGFQNKTWTSIITNYNTSFSNQIVVSKNTFSIFENEVLGTTFSHKYGSSTPPTLSTMA